MEKEMLIHALIFCVSILVIMRSIKRTDPKYCYSPDFTAGDLLYSDNGYQGSLANLPAIEIDNDCIKQEEPLVLAGAGSSAETRSAGALTPVHDPIKRLSIHLSQVAKSGRYHHSIPCVCLDDRSPPQNPSPCVQGLQKQYASSKIRYDYNENFQQNG